MNVLESGVGELLQPVDLTAFREWNRQKSRSLVDKRMSEEEAVRRFLKPGMYIGTELYGSVRCPMSLVREVLRQDIGELRVAGQGVLELDLLLAAHLVKALDLTYVGLELYGVSNCLRREVENGLVKVTDWSNASIALRFKAAAMGVPFLPTRSMLGTDTFKYSAAKIIECPFSGEPVCLLPALVLDVGLIHVHRADKFGNAQIDGITGFAVELSRASKTLIISTEEIVEEEFIRSQPDRTIIPYYLVDAVVEAPFGSHPGEMAYVYQRDEEHIKEWVNASCSEESTQEYLKKYIYNLKDHHDYLSFIGETHLKGLRKAR